MLLSSHSRRCPPNASLYLRTKVQSLFPWNLSPLFQQEKKLRELRHRPLLELWSQYCLLYLNISLYTFHLDMNQHWDSQKLSAIVSTNTLSIEQGHVMSSKPITSSTRPEYPVPSTSNDARYLFIRPQSPGSTNDLRFPSHSTHYGTTSSSRDQGRLTSWVGTPSKSVSMLDLWAYENRKEVLAFAERLEKKNWEAENSRL